MPSKKLILIGFIIVIALFIGYGVFSKVKEVDDIASEQEDILSDVQSELDDYQESTEYDLYADIQDFMDRQTSYVMQ